MAHVWHLIHVGVQRVGRVTTVLPRCARKGVYIMVIARSPTGVHARKAGQGKCYVLCAMCYVLCAMCYLLCAMCYVLCAMCYVPYGIYRGIKYHMLYATHYIPYIPYITCTMHHIPYTIYTIYTIYTMYYVPYTIYHIPCIIYTIHTL